MRFIHSIFALFVISTWASAIPPHDDNTEGVKPRLAALDIKKVLGVVATKFCIEYLHIPKTTTSTITETPTSFTTTTSTSTIIDFCTATKKRRGLASLIAYPKSAISSACKRLSPTPTATSLTTKTAAPVITTITIPAYTTTCVRVTVK